MTHSSKLYRNFAASALSAALILSAVAPVSAMSYTDVSERYKKAVEYLAVEKITEGLTATSFGTGQSIKRADAAILLAKAMELDLENIQESKFTDVPSRAKKYVDALKTKGIINGKTAERFASEQPITRGEAALMLAVAYELDAGTTLHAYTDVSPRYENAVNALLGSKITNGKTKTSFGVDQALTRGEFAIFLHNLSTLHIPKIQRSVASEADLIAALNNQKVDEILLSTNITAATLPVLSRNVKIDLNGKTLTGNIEYRDHAGTNAIQLFSTSAGGKLQGDLTIDVPKSDFIVDENVEITGKTHIINVKENTFYNYGVLNSVDITDADGVSFANQGSGSVNGMIALNTVGNVKLSGKLDLVEVNQPATITVETSSTINNLNIKVGEVVLNAPAGTVETLEAAPGIIVRDTAGEQVATKPIYEVIQPTRPAPTPVVIDVDKLIGSYEEKQKEYIEGDFINEERYGKYYELVSQREQLTKQIEAVVLSTKDKNRLMEIDRVLDKYLVESYTTTPSEYAEKIDLHTSDGTGVEIEWSSSHPDVISTEGKVTRPSKGEEAVKVTLTAKVIRNEESKIVDYFVVVEPEHNTYTSAVSLSAEQWEAYSTTNGYFTSRLDVNLNLEEIAKDYPGVQKAKVTINQYMSNESIKTIENINTESTITFLNPIGDTYFVRKSSVNVLIELLNNDNSVQSVFINQVMVENFMETIMDHFEVEKNSLTTETMYKYIPDFNGYTTEEKEIILTNFNALSDDQKTLKKLQVLAAELN